MNVGAMRSQSAAWFVAGALLAASVTAVLLAAWPADAAPGDSDTTFRPITACRLIDTRATDQIGPHGRLGADDTITVEAIGKNGACNIGDDAVGLSLNVTAIDASEPTFVTVWPAGDPPKASSLNPVPNQPPTPNAVATGLSGNGTFEVFNAFGGVDLIIDVNGVYLDSSLVELNQRLDVVEARKTLFNNNVPEISNQFVVLLTNVVFDDIPYAGKVVVTGTTDVEAVSGRNVTCTLREKDGETSMASNWVSPGSAARDTLTTTWVFSVDASPDPFNVGLYCGVVGADDATYSNARLTATYEPDS